MEDFYANLLGSYGPFAVFLLLMLTGIGIPLGEDVVIIPAGILAGAGTLDPWLLGLMLLVVSSVCTRWWLEWSEVKIEATAGFVQGAWAKALSTTSERAASASMEGEVGRG